MSNFPKVFVIGTRGFPNVQGGVEKHCEELYPRLAKLGFNIEVFTRTPYIPAAERLKEWKGIKFIHLWCPRKKSFEAIIHTFLGVMLARLRSPDILHIHAIGPSLLIPLAKCLGMKVVMTHHRPDYEREKWGRFAKIILKAGEVLGTLFADRIIAISKGIEKHLKGRGIKKVVYIPNGVSLPKILQAGETLRKYNVKAAEYIFTACRFVPEKGLHDLINAYGKIKNPDFKLVIAGDADHETDYSRGIKKMAGETEGVVLTGFVSGEPLQELFSNAGLFVLPSYYEGLPIALLEAMSYGLPVLVSDIPQNREVHLPDFRYFSAGDVEKLSVKIVELMKQGISEEEKKQQAEILINEYNWEDIARKTFEVYESIS